LTLKLERGGEGQERFGTVHSKGMPYAELFGSYAHTKTAKTN
jgi:hypothetical protein